MIARAEIDLAWRRADGLTVTLDVRYRDGCLSERDWAHVATIAAAIRGLVTEVSDPEEEPT